MISKLCLNAVVTLCLSASAVMSQSLSSKQAEIIPVAAFTATGDTKNLADALNKALDAGVSINELKEVLIQMYAYTGFPRSLTGLNTFLGVLDERKSKGISDTEGPAPVVLPPETDIRKVGTQNQTALIGRPAAGRIYEFAPAIDVFLKEHLFGDIFSRGVITVPERELATISALAALPAPVQLKSHVRGSLNVGVTPEQLTELVTVLKKRVGEAPGKLASDAVDSVLNSN